MRNVAPQGGVFFMPIRLIHQDRMGKPAISTATKPALDHKRSSIRPHKQKHRTPEAETSYAIGKKTVCHNRQHQQAKSHRHLTQEARANDAARPGQRPHITYTTGICKAPWATVDSRHAIRGQTWSSDIRQRK